jgi:hypothetical protein
MKPSAVTLAFLCLGSCLFSTSADGALYLQNYQASRHERFYTGGNKAFIGDGFDFSGIGQTIGDNKRYWATMISPSYFLSAAHYPPSANKTLFFYPDDTLANPIQYDVDSAYYIGTFEGHNSDLYLGKLKTPIDTSQIAYYPILSLDSSEIYGDAYLGNEIWTVGKGSTSSGLRTDRVGRNVIDEIGVATDGAKETVAMIYNYDVPGLGGDETFLISGDSGGPSFAIVDDALALVGIHYFNSLDSEHPLPPADGYYSGDSFVPYYVDQLNAHMGSEHVTLVMPNTPAPEPNSAAMLAGLAVVGLLLFLRRHT